MQWDTCVQPSAAGSVQVFSHHGLGFTTPVHKWKDENYATPIWFGQGELRLLLPLLVLVLSLVLPLLVLLLSLVLPLLVLLSYCCYHCWCCCRHWCYHTAAAFTVLLLSPLLHLPSHCCYICYHTAAAFTVLPSQCYQCCTASLTSAPGDWDMKIMPRWSTGHYNIIRARGGQLSCCCCVPQLLLLCASAAAAGWASATAVGVCCGCPPLGVGTVLSSWVQFLPRCTHSNKKGTRPQSHKSSTRRNGSDKYLSEAACPQTQVLPLWCMHSACVCVVSLSLPPILSVLPSAVHLHSCLSFHVPGSLLLLCALYFLLYALCSLSFAFCSLSHSCSLFSALYSFAPC